MTNCQGCNFKIALALATTITVACGGARTGTGGEEQPQVPVAGSVDISADAGRSRSPISPYVYGSNQDYAGNAWTVRRWGGNRTTGYNWETNFSNAGADYLHQSDLYLIGNAGLPASDASIPGRAMTYFHTQSQQMGAKSIITLQMAGYAAADGTGPVSAAETAPSRRWVKVEPRKNAPFSASPNVTDGVVYMDELVNLLVQRFGSANSPTGVRWYSLDNEPELWPYTHPRIHPDTLRAAELVNRSVALASAVKDVDPGAEILGPAHYGINAYVSLQDAPDWNAVKGGSAWFVDYYLDQMREGSERAGRRLLDVLDVHWYPEARGDHRVTDGNAITAKDQAARVEAPRTLWDSTYREESWVQQSLSSFLPILPRLQQSIDRHYPGTRLAVSEYNYGGGADISGGLAQADVLGVFGSHAVYIATLWGIGASDAYLSAAFNLYRNYDGKQGAFGNTSVGATTSDVASTSVYAAINDQDTAVMHVILLNKSAAALEARVRVTSATAYRTGDVWGFDAISSRVRQQAPVGRITGNAFTYVLPARTALHVVLR
jgi:mannan endo-1,4-beta-mannosidase